MAEDSKLMRFMLPEGGIVMLQWPDTVSLESLEMIEEMISIQLKSVRKAIELRKMAADEALQAQGAKE